MNVLDRISQNDFIATEDDVEALARNVLQGEGSKGTYLKVLVRRVQDMLSKSRPPFPRKRIQIKLTLTIRVLNYIAITIISVHYLAPCNLADI